MYLDFYRLSKAPFHITPDPEFLFLSPSHKAALGSIIYGIEERQGFVAISGEVGLGKTTILRSYLERVDQRQLKTIYIFNANVSFRGLLKAIFGEFGVEFETDDPFAMVNHLHQLLIKEYSEGRNVALIIDEAQNMPIETLENLRMLSNLETATEKLVQIILIGQPEFDHKLNLNELRQLKQRIVIRSTIEPLTSEESLAYVRHRLAKVAQTDEPVFTTRALKQIIDKAHGAPRVLNILCTNTLIAGFGYRQKPISATTAKEVIVDYEGKRKRSFCKPALVLATSIAVAAGVMWMSPYRTHVLDTLARTGYFPEVIQHLRGTPDDQVTFLAKNLMTYDNKPVVAAQLASQETPDRPLNDDSGSSSEVPTVVTPPLPRVDLQQDTALSRAPKKPSTPGPLHERPEFLPEHQAMDATTLPITRTVRKGEYVSRMAIEVYGFSNQEVLDALRRHNPQIADINRVVEGDKILFPALYLARE
jgi:general secretion pathway protein A